MTHPLEARIRLVVGDITKLDVDAVVTAANEALAGGGGVDGAVHAAAGHKLVAASRALAPCPAGNAKITPGFELDVDFVIHAVGPVYRDLDEDTATLLSTYRSALGLASENGVTHVAFPCISTGVYGFPAGPACCLAIDAVMRWMQDHAKPEIVTFCCFTPEDAELYRRRLEELGFTTLTDESDYLL